MLNVCAGNYENYKKFIRRCVNTWRFDIENQIAEDAKLAELTDEQIVARKKAEFILSRANAQQRQ
ncbi:hypothetical protein [Poriferisphaera corsica]|nr:hypothetical protein [Poriferisphaera corsica]